MQTKQITAIEAGFELSAQGKSKQEKMDMLLDYISDAQKQMNLSRTPSLIYFYQSEIDAAKNKLKTLVD